MGRNPWKLPFVPPRSKAEGNPVLALLCTNRLRLVYGIVLGQSWPQLHYRTFLHPKYDFANLPLMSIETRVQAGMALSSCQSNPSRRI